MLANSLNTGSSRSHRAPCVHLDDAMLATASAVSAHRSHAAETRGTRASTPYAARDKTQRARRGEFRQTHILAVRPGSNLGENFQQEEHRAVRGVCARSLARVFVERCKGENVIRVLEHSRRRERRRRDISPPPCARRDSFRTGIARWARCTPCRSSRPCTQSYPWPDSVSIARITPRRGINSDARQTRHPSPTSTAAGGRLFQFIAQVRDERWKPLEKVDDSHLATRTVRRVLARAPRGVHVSAHLGEQRRRTRVSPRF